MPYQENNLKPYQILSPLPHLDRKVIKPYQILSPLPHPDRKPYQILSPLLSPDRKVPPLSGGNPAAGHLTGEAQPNFSLDIL